MTLQHAHCSGGRIHTNNVPSRVLNVKLLPLTFKLSIIHHVLCIKMMYIGVLSDMYVKFHSCVVLNTLLAYIFSFVEDDFPSVTKKHSPPDPSSGFNPSHLEYNEAGIINLNKNSNKTPFSH